MKDILTFEDGILICKHIFQIAIDKTLNGVREEEEIFHRAHEMLKRINNKFSNERLDDILRILNLNNISTKI
jgi:hypothetical protein